MRSTMLSRCGQMTTPTISLLASVIRNAGCLFFVLIDRVLQLTQMQNGEVDVQLHSVIAHETETGYAQCFREDSMNPRMGEIALDAIVFSPAIVRDWSDPALFDKLKQGTPFLNPTEV